MKTWALRHIVRLRPHSSILKKLIKKQKNKPADTGNALFLILIAVALFAALSYAITQSGRGGGTINKEQAVISAAQITQFPASVRNVVTRMIITGTTADNLDFDTSATGEGAVFAPDGGGGVYLEPPANIGNAYGGTTGATAGTWGFKDVSDATLGFYVMDVGTNTDVSGRDVFAYLHDISLAVCQQINKGLSLNTDPSTYATAIDYSVGGGEGTATYTGGGVIDGAAGEPFLCYMNDTVYDYYHTLIEQ